uniref:Uncharacterized protein n=1 Tax=Tetraselmis sp. GSL018 TaxID=582737 RepID=A0A061S4V8_9CHLO|mmetsp:Transcript_29861/g.71171  ORF Transcript_29861/g.71171 Transcript_29861/m.71171 type:complete len:466 (-) Transcript_29861:148-1545(-)
MQQQLLRHSVIQGGVSGRTKLHHVKPLKLFACPSIGAARSLLDKGDAARRAVVIKSSYTPNGVSSEAEKSPSEVFGNIEKVIQDNIRARSDLPGNRDDWEEVEGCWVLRPPVSRGKPQAIVHFIGGAFVGSAPQFFYRLFLETLALRNVMVIATPYQTNFDHLRIADETQFRFDCAYRALASETSGLPIYGVGHSLGSLVHLLICTRYTVNRAGNALLSFNNRPATDSIPFLSPFIAPGAQMLFPVLQQLVSSPLRQPIEQLTATFKGLSPSAVKQAVPFVEQAGPILMDVASGRKEFTPSPFETQNLIKSYYGIPRNMLLRFQGDVLDESKELAQLLQGSAAISNLLDLTMRTLPGDHNRPLHQAVVDLPPELSRAARATIKEGSTILQRVSALARNAGAPEQFNTGLHDFANIITEGSTALGGNVGGPVTDEVQALADEVACWMGVGGVIPNPPKYIANTRLA